MKYFVVEIASTNEALNSILIAELSNIGYEGFEELDWGIKAYVEEQGFDQTILQASLDKYKALGEASLLKSYQLENKNWNEEWERNFEPIMLGKRILVKAPFHKIDETTYQYVIEIEPKMSFGTGHHETTRMMMQEMSEMDFSQKKVFDYGCGTGILAILAAQLGAHSILGIDIDEWAYRNALENIDRNQIDNVTLKQGDIACVPNQQFEVILANINRNIILDSLQTLVKSLVPGGQILLSGILFEDKELIENTSAQFDLTKVNELNEGKWVMLHFEK